MADRRRDSFREFLQALSTKPNSQLITEEKADRIRRVLACDDSSASVESSRFRFYVRSKGFRVIDLPVLGLQQVLCVPAPKGSETNTSLLGNYLRVASINEIYDILTTIHEGSRIHAGYRKVFADVRICVL
jgi:hypothetical protein